MPKKDMERRINQTPSGTGAGGVLVVPSSASIPPTAGPDIRVSGYQVSRAGAGVLLFDSGGAVLREYATITAALADSADGDVVEASQGTYTEDVTVPAGRILRGADRAGCIIAGTVTVKGTLSHCSVIRTANSATALTGVVSGAEGDEGALDDVTIDVQNSGGPAYAVYMAAGGDITAREADLLAEVGTDGYAAYVASGTFRHESGKAIGTTALMPYWKEA
jgi:hypothetical protein